MPSVVACNGAVGIELYGYGLGSLFLHMVKLIGMDKQLIVACNVVGSYLLGSSDIGTLHLFTCLFEGSSHEPAVFVLEHLMYTYLMLLATILETGVVNKIGTAVFSGDDGVMTL